MKFRIIYTFNHHFVSIKILEEASIERNRLRELMARQMDLEKVERSIVEVRDMFLRISTLVMEQVINITEKQESHLSIQFFIHLISLQSPLITQIEYHAHMATLNVDKGTNKLEKAYRLRIKRLKVNLFSINHFCIQLK